MVDVDPSLEFGTPTRHIRLRFSLRAFFVFVTALCVSLGWLYSSAKRQERAVAGIQELGGRVVYDWQLDGTAPAKSRLPPGPIWLRKLLGPHYFDTAVGVDIAHTLVHGSPNQFAPFRTHLLKLPHLKRLRVFWLELSDAGYAVIGQLQRLEYSCLTRMKLSEAGAAQIARLSNLRELSLSDDIVPAAALVQIQGLPKLQSLCVSCRHEDRAPNGAPIWNLEKYAIRDDASTSLPSHPQLRTLELTFTQITDDGVSILSHMKQLKALGINSPQITNASMDHLTKLQDLERLELSACKMDRAGVAKLVELPKLTALRISGEKIDNDCLPIIASLNRLQELDLAGKTIDDRGLHHLEGMKNLKYLDVQSTNVTTDGPEIVRLKKALPNCRIRQHYPSPSFR